MKRRAEEFFPRAVLCLPSSDPPHSAGQRPASARVFCSRAKAVYVTSTHSIHGARTEEGHVFGHHRVVSEHFAKAAF